MDAERSLETSVLLFIILIEWIAEQIKPYLFTFLSVLPLTDTILLITTISIKQPVSCFLCKRNNPPGLQHSLGYTLCMNCYTRVYRLAFANPPAYNSENIRRDSYFRSLAAQSGMLQQARVNLLFGRGYRRFERGNEHLLTDIEKIRMVRGWFLSGRIDCYPNYIQHQIDYFIDYPQFRPLLQSMLTQLEARAGDIDYDLHPLELQVLVTCVDLTTSMFLRMLPSISQHFNDPPAELNKLVRDILDNNQLARKRITHGRVSHSIEEIFSFLYDGWPN